MSEQQDELYSPDDVYRMPAIGVGGPAHIIKCMVPYLGHDDTRPALKFINIDDKSIYAADGKRLIRMDRDKLVVPIPNGAFRPVKDGKDYLLIAHEAELALPNLDGLVLNSHLHEFKLAGFDNDGGPDVSQLLYKLARWGVCISHKYAQDVPCGDYVVRVGSSQQPVTFKGEFTCVIAPLRLEGE